MSSTEGGKKRTRTTTAAGDESPIHVLHVTSGDGIRHKEFESREKLGTALRGFHGEQVTDDPETAPIPPEKLEDVLAGLPKGTVFAHRDFGDSSEDAARAVSALSEEFLDILAAYLWSPVFRDASKPTCARVFGTEDTIVLSENPE